MEGGDTGHDLMNCSDQEVSEEIVIMWPRDWSCDTLVKKWLLFLFFKESA